MIKWCKPDEYVISLGVPIGESGNYNSVFEEKYIKDRVHCVRTRRLEASEAERI